MPQAKKAALLLIALSCAFASARADDLLLAPGKSITILDAADPSVRVVIQAPPNAPLNLSTLLSTDANDSVHAIVTRMQVKQAGRITQNPDGSLSLSAAPNPGSAPRGPMLEGGVLVYNAGKYVLHSAAAAPAAPAGGGGAATLPEPVSWRLLISKPGVSKEQAERDLRQCRAIAENAAAQFLKAADKAIMYNTAMRSCLRSFGYEIRSPAA